MVVVPATPVVLDVLFDVEGEVVKEPADVAVALRDHFLEWKFSGGGDLLASQGIDLPGEQGSDMHHNLRHLLRIFLSTSQLILQFRNFINPFIRLPHFQLHLREVLSLLLR